MKGIKKTVSILFFIIILIAACNNSTKKSLVEIENEHASEMEEKAADWQETQEGGQLAEFDGIINKSESGLLLQTGAGKFTIKGKGLTDMTGKKVKIIGRLEESGNGKKIHVTTITPLE